MAVVTPYLFQLSGSTSVSLTHLETVTSACLSRIMMNTALWDEDSDGGNRTFVPPRDVTSVACPAQCNDRGWCQNGETV